MIYTLVLLLFALLVGPKIFQGPGLGPKGPMWSYAYLTMIVVLAPAVTDGFGSDGATSAFYTRLFLFIVIAVYGSIGRSRFRRLLAAGHGRKRFAPGKTRSGVDSGEPHGSRLVSSSRTLHNRIARGSLSVSYRSSRSVALQARASPATRSGESSTYRAVVDSVGRFHGALKTGSPSLIVSSTSRPQSSSGAILSGLALRITKSASFPTSIEPFRSSSKY